MDKLSLTERQKQIYKFIEDYQLEKGNSPKIAEIQHSFGIKSVNGVIKHLRALEKKGWIARDNTPRGIGLLDRAKRRLTTTMNNIPIFGMIPAGNPQSFAEYIEGYLPMDLTLVPNPDKSFALTVKGESMIDAGIFEGDIIIAEQREPRKNDVVVALIDGENTLKRFIINETGVPYLKAENSIYPDIYPANSLEIQGVVIYLVRKYK